MSDETDQPANRIIVAFGGIRPMAARLDIPVSTVQGWKQRDSIPAGRMEAVRAAAIAGEIDLDINRETGDLDVAAPSDAATAEPVSVKPRERGPLPEDSTEKSSESVISAPKDPAAPPARGSRVAVLALVVALGVGGWVWWSTQGPGANGGDNARFSALEGRVARLAGANGESAPAADSAALAALTRDVAALRSKLADLSPPDMGTALAPLQAEIDGLRDALAAQAARGKGGGGNAGLDAALLARLEAIDVEIQNAIQLASTNMQAMAGGLLEFDSKLKALAEAQAKSRAELGARIDAIEKGQNADQTEASRASILALAAGQLRTALERGAPYISLLDLLETASADDPKLGKALTVLRGMSDTGVATGSALELSFTKLVPDLLAAHHLAAGDRKSDLIDRLAGRINDFVSVRRTGADVPGDDVEARIARAEIFLANRDVVAAILEFNDLTGPAADILVPWLIRARGHVDARDALAVFEAEAVARLRTDGGS
ncbi:MAG: hypothetical protein HOK98_00210 [Rhodospirillaceae bacterium]|jgi:hypothetical protein|nr:hypothetical protein [Rhodospirillaceae bacterium]MBT5944334.1 hypothetical protein [Rhodospirillaceae bacterium]MBT6404259.1 hypothetical protein [Rhodospirillaceae bacterium]MBT6534578.1 hypothetical protein [Rhodospirillaceae bacterium]MBT7362101.1 hypothetical protein [Rhodospirillaceae bacterium]